MNREAIVWACILVVVLTVLVYHLMSTIHPAHISSTASEHAGAAESVQ